jgi:quinol-cytochrome oxidoreductase complex cytochrome b subunit
MYSYDPEEYSALEPLFPNALVTRGLAAVAALILWVGLAFFWPELLMPSNRPSGGGEAGLTTVLPWYLWPAVGLCRLFSSGIALVLLLAAGAALLLLPFWDKAGRDYFWDRYVYSRLVLGWFTLTLFLGFWGLFA